jgi:ferredoxin-NADP reductase
MSRSTVTTLTLSDTDHHPDGTAALHFRPARPLRFTAGQYGLWIVAGGGARSLTIASAPEEERITIGTTLHPSSRFQRALGALEIGSSVHVVGPVGGFTLAGTAPEVVMLAEGACITPFRSMLRHAALTGSTKITTLVHLGAWHPFGADTAEAAGEAWYPTTREEFWLTVRDAARDQREATFMVSGSPAFVRSTSALLAGELISSAQIRRDRSYGYHAPAVADRRTPVDA